MKWYDFVLLGTNLVVLWLYIRAEVMFGDYAKDADSKIKSLERELKWTQNELTNARPKSKQPQLIPMPQPAVMPVDPEDVLPSRY